MSGLKDAPAHVKLAIDLIMLLEQHQIPPQQALDALVIVCDDCKNKLADRQKTKDRGQRTEDRCLVHGTAT